MRIYISADLEGVHGMERWDNHDIKNPEYQDWKQRVSKLMHDEIMALYRGFLQKGAVESYVLDSHGFSSTLQIEDSHSQLTQVRRDQDNYVHFPRLDDSFSGIIFWGYHVKSGSTDGRLAHTASRRIKQVRVNGQEVGEVYVHAYYTSFYSVPVIAASGDSGLQKEISRDVGDIPFFNSDIGDQLPRDIYLQTISDFAENLDIDHAIKLNNSFTWPESSRIIEQDHTATSTSTKVIAIGQ